MQDVIMQKNVTGKYNLYIILTFILFIPVNQSEVIAGPKAGIYGIFMAPDGEDAENYSDAGFGFGLHIVLPAPQLLNILAGTAGFEITNLLTSSIDLRDPDTGLLVVQNTDQNYMRLYLGAQAGGHGNGFFRPHAGMNLALIYYSISTDLVIPDSYGENEIVQNLDSEGHVVFGYDITLGIDLNFSNKFMLDGGVRYLKTFSVPQQLGDEGSVKIHPQYFQVYLGIGIGI
jgi:hypothetical protein